VKDYLIHAFALTNIIWDDRTVMVQIPDLIESIELFE
jgi:hypothetical protein